VCLKEVHELVLYKVNVKTCTVQSKEQGSNLDRGRSPKARLSGII
jgi:hypothetical protein